MSKNYDNWERLVRAVMRREDLKRLARWPSMESISIISSASSSFRLANSTRNGSSNFRQSFQFPELKADDRQGTMARSESLRYFVDQRSGEKCCMVGAGGLRISSAEDSQSWKWTTFTDPSDRFSEVAELQSVWLLDIRCKIQSQILIQRRTYEAHLVFKLAKKYKGLESAKGMIQFVGDEPEKDVEKRARIVHFDLAENRRGSNAVERDDGWMELEIGNFYIGRGEMGEVEARVMEKSWSFVKTGLLVGGIEFRPTIKYSTNPVVSKQCLSRRVMA